MLTVEPRREPNLDVLVAETLGWGRNSANWSREQRNYLASVVREDAAAVVEFRKHWQK